ncbi:histidine phosphatase family protein [Brachybacterium hainanense]|uniref:Histidine phosphatase family protein n=1 Tax=Brachybacterium hainanense TaxID=1541174 RepID=A0ABV6R931_9MICO
MATRHLYIARHGEADAFGALTERGAEQARLLGRRLAHLPLDAVWHSPLPRAADSARQLNILLSGAAPVAPAPELVDHVPHVPSAAELPPSWVPFFDGYDEREAAAGQAVARRLVARFAAPSPGPADMHEVLITHDYPIAWLIRDALGAPPVRWLGLHSANAALTVIEHRADDLPSIRMVNDMSHLPEPLRWTGFPAGLHV